ncbi:MAG TPA: ribosome-associated heat shock protein Hsp15 [Dongiaceae bacterium]|nr:ribosome-associated heat shock protein Hsp15 [Dongiaceae bacterium]
MDSNDSSNDDKVRLDKWLWAARFYKTRTIAKEMIEGGKVHYDSHRVKASKEVVLGATIRLRQGLDEKTVLVTGLDTRRGNATKAATLYQETTESLEKRQQAALQRKILGSATPGASDHRPNKKERRQITQFRQQND